MSGTEPPPTGSLAAEDDAYLKPFGALLQELVHFRLRSAWDHLQATKLLLEDSPTTTAPFAPYTVTRAALVAAAIASWLVAGDESERRWNALIIHARDVRRDKWFLEANREDMQSRLERDGLEKFDAAIENRDQVLRMIESKLGDPDPGRDRRFDEKKVVEHAQSLFAPTDYPVPRMGVMYMRLSGVAHALPWASNRNRHKVAELRGGLERYVHEGDRSEIMSCVATTTAIATEARKRFEYLCSTAASVEADDNQGIM